MQQTVMIVEDALFIRTVLRGMLEDHGCRVIGEAGTALDAMRQLRDLRPELLFLDIILPDANGIEVLDELHASYPDLKIIICSSLGQESTVKKALQHGACAYLQKPVTADALSSTLSSITRS